VAAEDSVITASERAGQDEVNDRSATATASVAAAFGDAAAAAAPASSQFVSIIFDQDVSSSRGER
jgi:hypothetical protein